MGNINEEELLEPLKYYKEELEDKFSKILKNNFENLLKESKISIDKNRETVKEYNELFKVKGKNERKLKWLKFFSFLVLVGIVYFVLVDVNVIKNFKSAINLGINYTDSLIKTIYISVILLALIILNFKYLRRKKNELNETINQLQDLLEKKKNECYSQVKPLLELFDDNIANKIITQIVPNLILDKDFDFKRYSNLVYNFGLPKESGKKYTTKDIISGEILGNPFVIMKETHNKVVDQEYRGSLEVSWEEYYTENGQRKSRVVRETLTASVIKPKQVFEDSIKLIYGNEVAEHLTFFREPNYIHNLKPKKLESYIKKKIDEVKKKSERAIKTGGTFLEMGNLEFDALFRALNRDNEVEFRVLFTPIAQKNMISLLTDEDFGDDFIYHKDKKLNIILNNEDWVLNVGREIYNNFSYDNIEKIYYEINEKYFKNFYKLFLPILSIPVYHQHKAQSYIYESDFNYNPYTAETMANLLGDKTFLHPESTTQGILKTTTIQTNNDIDLVDVICNSYKEVKKIDYVPRRARNGSMYSVPVEWIDYVPLTSEGRMELKRVNATEREFSNSINSDFIRETSNRRFGYKNNIFAIFTDKNKITCNEIFNKIDN